MSELQKQINGHFVDTREVFWMTDFGLPGLLPSLTRVVYRKSVVLKEGLNVIILDSWKMPTDNWTIIIEYNKIP